MAELTTQRLIELIERYETWPKDTGAFLTELLERRKAEECQECLLGYRRGEDDVVIECPDCHGTGKQGNAELIAEALSDARGIVEALLDECRGSAGSERLGERIEDAEQWMRGTYESGADSNAELIAALRADMKSHSAVADECYRAGTDFGHGRSYGIACLIGDIKKSLERAEGKRV